MIIQKYNSEEEWLDGRMGKVTGTRLKDLIVKRGTAKKKGFYEIIAERVAIPASGENVMDRGHRLETDALERFAKETGKKVNTDLVIWSRDDNNDIAISPDGYVDTSGDIKREDCEHAQFDKKCSKCGLITEAIEVKCLNSASHIEAFLTQEIPSEYEAQRLQYFIVNDDLKVLYFTFYDPRMPKDFFFFTIKREDVQKEVEEYLALERQALLEIEEIEKQLTF